MDGGRDYNIPTRDEIRAAYRQREEAIIQLFERLIQELQAQQDRLNKNSKNSSKPPSSDGLHSAHTTGSIPEQLSIQLR